MNTSDINQFYHELCKILLDAHEETHNFQIMNSIDSHYSNNNKGFSSELREIKSKIMQIKNQATQTEASSAQLVSLRRSFRRIQRLSLYKIEQKKLKSLEKLAKERNKNKF